ncbi:MAG: UPF0182 family protein, partial [Acidimicrobiales bacterium]
MPAGTELPRRSRRYPGGFVGLLGTLVLVVLGVVALRGIAVTFTNYLWFGSVGLASVWRNIISTRAALALVFSGIFALSCWISLAVAQRMAQPSDLDLRSRSVDFDGESSVA